jgi:hypothetical protein
MLIITVFFFIFSSKEREYKKTAPPCGSAVLMRFFTALVGKGQPRLLAALVGKGQQARAFLPS